MRPLLHSLYRLHPMHPRVDSLRFRGPSSNLQARLWLSQGRRNDAGAGPCWGDSNQRTRYPRPGKAGPAHAGPRPSQP